jgi:hypothetical protein
MTEMPLVMAWATVPPPSTVIVRYRVARLSATNWVFVVEFCEEHEGEGEEEGVHGG